MIKVVQFSLTDLAGAPIRVSQAVNLLEDIEVRNVDLYKSHKFDQDIIFSERKEEVYEICKKADIIHLYNYINLETNDFHPIDFKELQKKGKKIIQHFQSTPMLVSKKLGISTKEVIDYPLPKIVIAQYPERFFPNAKVVPNIVPQDNELYKLNNIKEDIDMIFAPSWDRSAWESRWDTKGLPETKIILNKMNKKYKYNSKILRGIPLKEVMEFKKRSKLILDEMVTGSYHLSALEGLCLEKPVLTYLDNRVDKVIKHISGSSSIPFVNIRFEELEKTSLELLNDESTRKEIGKSSREWIDYYWQDKKLAQQFKKVYEDLLENPYLIKRQPELSLDDKKEYFFSVVLPDKVWETRKKNYFSIKISLLIIFRKTKFFLKKLIKKFF